MGDWKLQIHDEHMEDFVCKLKVALADFLQAETGQVGSGLLGLLRGSGTWSYLSIIEYAKVLITGAAKLDAKRVVELLFEWIQEGSLHYRHCVLLEGLDIDEPIELPEGIQLSKLPMTPEDLPASLPHDPAATTGDYLGNIVLSMDCKLKPALYNASKKEESTNLDAGHNKLEASLPIPGLSSDQYRCSHSLQIIMVPGIIECIQFNSFCESLSLACDGYVGWRTAWTNYGELDAFHYPLRGSRKTFRSGVPRENLNMAREIQCMRYSNGDTGKNLNLAIYRWARSKCYGLSTSDALIDLRIALEALYEIDGSEKCFRLATYAAWHLGDSFEDRYTYSKTLRAVYSHASKFIHAREPNDVAKSLELISSGQDLCRRGILKRLQESKKPNWDELILGM